MIRKAEWKRRALDAEARLAAQMLEPPPTIDTLEVDFEHRAIRFRGRTIESKSAIIAIPLTSGTVLYAPHHDTVL